MSVELENDAVKIEEENSSTSIDTEKPVASKTNKSVRKLAANKIMIFNKE